MSPSQGVLLRPLLGVQRKNGRKGRRQEEASLQGGMKEEGAEACGKAIKLPPDSDPL